MAIAMAKAIDSDRIIIMARAVDSYGIDGDSNRLREIKMIYISNTWH